MQSLRHSPTRTVSSSLLAGLLLVLAAPAFATTTLDLGYGNSVESQTARAAGMGDTGIGFLSGSSAIIQNPALLSRAPGKGFFDLSLAVWQASEDRFVPLFDSFDSFVANTAFALNKHSYWGGTGGFVYHFGGEMPMALGVGLFQRWGFDYQYQEEVRDPNPFSDPTDRVVQLREYTIDGSLRSLSIGYGAQLFRYLELGLSVHYYYGTLSHDAVFATTPGFENRYLNSPGNETFDHELNGWGWSLGASSKLSDRVDLGVSYEGPFAVTGAISRTDTVTQWVPYDDTVPVLAADGSDIKIKYPGTLRMGFAFHPRAKVETTFAIDAVFRWWEEVQDFGYRVDAFVDQGNLRNTWDLRTGVEHIFSNNLPVRLGFRYLQNYADRESSRSIFTAGVGFNSGGWRIDIGGQYHQQISRQDYLLERDLVLWGASGPGGDDFDQINTFTAPESTNKVEDSMVVLMLSVTRTF